MFNQGSRSQQRLHGEMEENNFEPVGYGGRGAEGKWRIYLVDSIASTRLYKQRIIVMADSELTTRRFPGIISPSG